MSEETVSKPLKEQAKALLRTNRAGEAVSLLMGAEGLDEDAELQETLAVAHFVLKDYQGAEEAFLGALRVEPRRVSAMINLGAVYNRSQQFAKAVDIIRKALAFEKKSAEAYYNLGFAHRNLKQFPLAIPAYREAIRLNPQMADAYQNLGNVYYEMGSYPQAISHFSKALAIDPNHVRAVKGLEAAQSAAEVAKREMNSPFGRLVDERELGRQIDAVEASGGTRRLSDEDRYYDRQVVHKSAGDIDRQVRALATLLREELVPAMKAVNRAIAEQAPAAQVLRVRKEFESSRAGVSMHARQLARLLDLLARHDAKMR
jgi:tetratricopeptide (TPR) repeat protein